jgi:hypothetical protein
MARVTQRVLENVVVGTSNAVRVLKATNVARDTVERTVKVGRQVKRKTLFERVDVIIDNSNHKTKYKTSYNIPHNIHIQHERPCCTRYRENTSRRRVVV